MDITWVFTKLLPWQIYKYICTTIIIVVVVAGNKCYLISKKRVNGGCEKWMWDFSLIKMLNRKGFVKFRLEWKLRAWLQGHFLSSSILQLDVCLAKNTLLMRFWKYRKHFHGHHHRWKTLLNDMLISASFWHGQLKSIKKSQSHPLCFRHTHFILRISSIIRTVVWGEKKR